MLQICKLVLPKVLAFIHWNIKVCLKIELRKHGILLKFGKCSWDNYNFAPPHNFDLISKMVYFSQDKHSKHQKINNKPNVTL